MSVIPRLNELHPEMTTWRRELHAHPQTAFEETFASEFIAQKLQAWGIETKAWQRLASSESFRGVERRGQRQRIQDHSERLA